MKIEKDKRTTGCTHLLLLHNWPLDGESIQINSFKRQFKGNKTADSNNHAMHLIFIEIFLLLQLGLFSWSVCQQDNSRSNHRPDFLHMNQVFQISQLLVGVSGGVRQTVIVS